MHLFRFLSAPAEAGTRRRSSVRLRPLLAGLLLALATHAGAADLEAKMYVITDWLSTECEGGDRSSWAEMVDGWYDAIDNYGKAFRDGRMVNGDMNLTIFCDADTNSACRDHARVDDADIAMIGLHGIDKDDHWAGLMRRKELGRCSIHAPQRVVSPDSPRMHLGNSDLEFFHMSSCESLNQDHWDNARLMFGRGGENRLHMATGFHGVMWISSGYDDEYEDFALDGHFALSSAWIENLYEEDASDAYDQCPVAMSVGSSEQSCVNRLLTENYLAPQNPDPSNRNYWCTRYVAGCDPKSEGPLE